MNGRSHPSLLNLAGAASLLVLGGLLNARQTTGQTGSLQAPEGQVPITAAKAGSGPAAKFIPFSAEEVSETTRTLEDGTRITRKTFTRIFRDGEGRIRTQSYAPENGSSQPENESPRFISIVDHVADVRYVLNTLNHTAQRASLTPPPGAPGSRQNPINPHPPSAGRPKPVIEDLGDREIEGFTAHGTRTTYIIPAGAEDNDQPIVTVAELWHSPELNRAVLANVHDPRRGDTTTRLINIMREEPSPDLFQVPADYTITEEQPVRQGSRLPNES